MVQALAAACWCEQVLVMERRAEPPGDRSGSIGGMWGERLRNVRSIVATGVRGNRADLLVSMFLP